MPKTRKAKKGSGKGPATRARRADEVPKAVEDVERVDLFADDPSMESGDGKAPAPQRSSSYQNVVDFEAFLKESGLLEVQRCGGAQGIRDVIDGNNAATTSHPLPSGSEPSRSFSDEVFVHIPVSIREQIWRGEFVNLALMLKGAVELTDICSSNMFTVNSNGTLEVKPRPFRESITSVERWTDAFLIYMAVVLVKKPTLASQLVRYITIIREAAQGSTGSAWVTYDEQFRMRQAAHPGPWNEINTELWMRFFRFNGILPGNNLTGSYNPSFVSAAQPAMGKCFDFNKGHCLWPNCRFLHACEECGQKHGKVYCPQLAVARNGVNRTGQIGRGMARGPSFRPSRGTGYGFRRARGYYGRGHYRGA